MALCSSNREWVDSIRALSPGGVDVPERLRAHIGVSSLEQDGGDQMDDRVDIIITRIEKVETEKLAKDVPHESPKASRVLDHELEEVAFKAKRSTDDRVEDHAVERDAPD